MSRKIQLFRPGLATLLLSVLLAACSGTGMREMPLSANLTIDLPRYMGEWHVIANIPYFAENGKVASRDVYRLD